MPWIELAIESVDGKSVHYITDLMKDYDIPIPSTGITRVSIHGDELGNRTFIFRTDAEFLSLRRYNKPDNWPF